MQKEDYDLIWKRGRLTINERDRLEKEVAQGSINHPGTDTPSFAIAKAHKQMRERLAADYYKTFSDGINKILKCKEHIAEIRDYIKSDFEEDEVYLQIITDDAREATEIINLVYRK